jgi:hypothetical protein
MLPPSSLDRDDYPPGPWGMARLCEDRIAQLEEAKAACGTKAERRPINQHLHTLRGILRWCESLAGYRNPFGNCP